MKGAAIPLVIASLCSPVLAQHVGDAILTVTDNTITSDARVYGATLGQVIPNEIDNPGFDGVAGTFNTGYAIGFRILDALRVWDGSDFDAVAAPTMTLSFSSLNATTPAAPGTVEGFTLPVQAGGEWHRHFIFTLNSPATNGVYLLALQLFGTDPLLNDSLPFWLVFNQNVSMSVHNAAIAWAQANLPVEPLVLGDTDTDGDVDADDLFNVKQNFGDLGPDSLGDADGDGDADIDDLVAVKNNFGVTQSPGTARGPQSHSSAIGVPLPGLFPVFVPEPTSIALLGFAAVILLGRVTPGKEAVDR